MAAPLFSHITYELDYRRPPNAHAIIMDVRELLIRGGAKKHEVAQFQEAAVSGSWGDLVKLLEDTVTVIKK